MSKLTEKQIKKAIDSMVILIDTREKLPNHITQAFDEYGVNWERRKLKSGDYSAYVPMNEELGIVEEMGNPVLNQAVINPVGIRPPDVGLHEIVQNWTWVS